MKFETRADPNTRRQLTRAEKLLGIELPTPVRELYVKSNGGTPSPYVFENDRVDTVVAEFLPLAASDGASAADAYARLVVEKRLVPAHFFPFAVDGGGDYFFVDCSTPDGRVHLYRGDSRTPGLLDLSLGFDAFWRALKDEG